MDDGRGALAERERVLALVQRHGYNTTSFQALEDGFLYWWNAACTATVAYVDTGRAWVAAGAPIAAEDELARTTVEFLAAADAAGRRATFFAAQARLHLVAGLESVPIGLQPVFDPREWAGTLARRSSLRAQLARATRKGVRVRRLAAQEVEARHSDLRAELERLIDRWHDARHMSPMGFLVRVQPFTFADERRLYVAEQEGRIVGFLSAVPVYARGGWFCEDLLRDPAAPNGTVELLIDAALTQAAREGSTWVTLGLAPLSGAVPRWMRRLGRIGQPLYGFAGLHEFKSKLQPAHWEPVYVLHPRGASTVLAIVDALRAFSGGSFVVYAVRSLLHGPLVVLWALALLLLPWTVLLALAPTWPWFPTHRVQQGWVAFDACLFAALVVLCRKPRPHLALTLVVVVAFDALATTLEAGFWNLPRARGWTDALIVLAACAGPSLAAWVLWRTWRRGRDVAAARPRT